MNILIVDDQINVIHGLMTSIDFQKLGYQRVASALNADDALRILESEPIHVLVSDIEMPGKCGLELNAIVKERYPEVLRILLTSHANFSYAKEGLRLGCFDYLVQPVPYLEIEEALARAAMQVQLNDRRKQMYSLGNLFDSNRTEFLNSVMLKLFTTQAESGEESLRLLREAGYRLEPRSYVKLLLVDVMTFSGRRPEALSMNDTIMTIKMTIRGLDLPDHIDYIIGKNRYNQFVVLFFSHKVFDLSAQHLETLYARMGANLHSPIACYVGWSAKLSGIRPVVTKLHEMFKDNISREPELVYVHRGAAPERVPTSLSGFLSRWEALLKAGRKNLLQKDIFSYLDRNLSNSTNGFYDLCVLHQSLTQMFFNYFYSKNIDIVALFNHEMSYEAYMDSCSTIDSVKRAVEFLIFAANQQEKQESELGYVERAKTYILENSDKLLTVRDVSEYISLNPEYFTRLFKKETGYNIKDYIIQCKLSIAKDLLVNSDLPISMVALELGYSNFSHFTQMFKRAEGITPKEYRIQQRGQRA